MIRKLKRSSNLHQIALFSRSYCVQSATPLSKNDNNIFEPAPHIPVMAKEVVNSLNPENGKIYIDMTFGAGGHTKKILESAPNIRVIAVDRDADALKHADKLNTKFPNQIIPLKGKFSDLPELLTSINVERSTVDGILFDFGCSSMQFDQAERGFSINKDGPLDMRMDKDPDNPTAADILATIEQEDLYKIIKYYGEEKRAKVIAQTITDVRYACKSIRTTHELARIVDSCFSESAYRDKLNRPTHNATKTFQALRIFVNNELNEINYGLQCAEQYLKVGGRLVALTFHSLEDAIVKRFLLNQVIGGVVNALPLKYINRLEIQTVDKIEEFMGSNWEPLYKGVLIPSPKEIDLNPRSRSAKLRAATKISEK